jgi:hypothetical protein
MRRLSGYGAYSLYLSIRLHFTSEKYDAIKYNFKSRATLPSFEKRKDKYFFERLAKLYPSKLDMTYFFVSHMVMGNEWVGDMLEDPSKYQEWKRYNEAPLYFFEKDLKAIAVEVNEFDAMFLSIDTPIPIVINMIIRGDIRPETFLFIDRVTNALSDINRRMVSSDLIGWSD